MVRGQMNFKRLSLTDIKIDIPRLPKKKSLIAAMEAAGMILCIASYLWSIVVHLLIHFDCRCEEQMGEELMGKEAYCAEEESFTQWLWKVQGHAGKDQGLLQVLYNLISLSLSLSLPHACALTSIHALL